MLPMDRMYRPPASKSAPNGVGPGDVTTVGPLLGTPLAPSPNSTRRLVGFSVTTMVLPLGLMRMEPGPGVAAPLSARVEPARGVSEASLPTRKPLMLPPPMAFTTYSTVPFMARLTGMVPPELTVLTRVRSPEPLTRNDATSLLPAFTTNSMELSLLRITASCDSSGSVPNTGCGPLPRPPVDTESARTRLPSSARSYTST